MLCLPQRDMRFQSFIRLNTQQQSVLRSFLQLVTVGTSQTALYAHMFRFTFCLLLCVSPFFFHLKKQNKNTTPWIWSAHSIVLKTYSHKTFAPKTFLLTKYVRRQIYCVSVRPKSCDLCSEVSNIRPLILGLAADAYLDTTAYWWAHPFPVNSCRGLKTPGYHRALGSLTCNKNDSIYVYVCE